MKRLSSSFKKLHLRSRSDVSPESNHSSTPHLPHNNDTDDNAHDDSTEPTEAEAEEYVTVPSTRHRLDLGMARKEKGWKLLRVVLKAVCDASDIFPPLKSALSGALSVMDVIDVSIRWSFVY